MTSTFTINGKTFNGTNIEIKNNKVFIDGIEYNVESTKILEVRVLEGIIGSIKSDASVTANDVHGNIAAGGSVAARNVEGNVSAGGSVTAADIRGSVSAGGSVRYGV